MSLMNGLSALGAGVAQFAGTAGIEAQKADLARQSLMLADQLATTRETALATQQQTFQGGENQKTREATAANEATRLAVTQSEGAATRAGEMARTQATINAPTPTAKLLRELGVPLPGDTSGTAPSPQAGPRASQAAPTGVTGTPDIMDNPLVAKALGQPMAGSEDAIRRAIASDVNSDPTFKYKTAGQKASEIENRLAVAGAKIGSSDSLDALSTAIAKYKLSPLDARARMTAGGPEVMAQVLAKNPDFNETNYDAIKESQKAIAPGGTLFTPISAMETSIGHASHFLDIATKLGNNAGGNWFNIIPNKIAENTGNQPLVNALQQTAYAMAEEGNRIYAGNAGTESAINNWYKSFPVNGSLADQVGAVKNFAQLMGDKFDAMTGKLEKTFTGAGLPPVELLSPKANAAYQRLISMGPDGKPEKGATPLAPVTGAPASTSLPDPLGIR